MEGAKKGRGSRRNKGREAGWTVKLMEQIAFSKNGLIVPEKAGTVFSCKLQMLVTVHQKMYFF